MKKNVIFFYFILLSIFANAQNNKSIIVSKDGSGNYTTLQAAFDAIPSGNTAPILIFIKKGIYKERVVLETKKDNITIVGESRDSTILTYNNHTGSVLPNGDIVNTYTSASFFIYADGFTAKNITIQNDAGFNAGQAVALFVYGNHERFIDCNLKGFQDVLFCSGKGTKQYYENCSIEGTTDFIFGPATAVFKDCLIKSKKNSHVTAASTPGESPFGFVFFNSKLIASDTSVNKVSLGRPWQPYSNVTYINCYLDKHIIPEGWNNWKNPSNELTARYAEYKSVGPGANVDTRVKWSRQLTDDEVKKYTIQNVLGDWVVQ
jgi:pectinesterase